MKKCKKCKIGLVKDSMERNWLIEEGETDFNRDNYLSIEMFKFCPFCGREIKETEKCIIT